MLSSYHTKPLDTAYCRLFPRIPRSNGALNPSNGGSILFQRYRRVGSQFAGRGKRHTECSRCLLHIHLLSLSTTMGYFLGDVRSTLAAIGPVSFGDG